MKNKMKKFTVLFVITILSFILCGCGESDSAKLDRLTREAEQKKREAQEARDNYNTLKNFMDKYGNQ
ncbi:MAG: hypothetical protein IJ662_12355 [Clostridia bacterium]|nr:hypothetical protein [Clostridia bacterium]